jgi:hypothetical protein
MLSVTAGNRRLGDGTSRREILRIGAASLLGLTLPDLLKGATATRAKARSCILFFLPDTLIRDPLDRPHFVSTGTPIGALVG